nr:hypothetical protein CFP56_52966 [Quercus suber]
MLDDKPLPSDACVHVWGKGAGGHIAQTLARGLLLPEDVRAFEDGTDESMGRRLQWHTVAAAQLAYILDRRVTDLAEDASRERALKDVAEVTAKEKTVVAATSEKKAAAAEKARLAVEKSCYHQSNNDENPGTLRPYLGLLFLIWCSLC